MEGKDKGSYWDKSKCQHCKIVHDKKDSVTHIQNCRNMLKNTSDIGNQKQEICIKFEIFCCCELIGHVAMNCVYRRGKNHESAVRLYNECSDLLSPSSSSDES